MIALKLIPSDPDNSDNMITTIIMIMIIHEKISQLCCIINHQHMPNVFLKVGICYLLQAGVCVSSFRYPDVNHAQTGTNFIPHQFLIEGQGMGKSKSVCVHSLQKHSSPTLIFSAFDVELSAAGI